MPLGESYPIEFEKTRMRVLREAAGLFALKGFEGVSMNEIAQAVGIKAPSLYNHFTNKNQILDAIFTLGIEWMAEYYRRFKEADLTSASLEESMENIFVEIRRIVDPFGYQAILLAQRYSGSNPLAFQLFYEAFYSAGLASIRSCMQRGQQKGFVPTGLHIDGFATLMMDFVTHNSIYGSLATSPPYRQAQRSRAWYDSMQEYFIAIVRAGI